jgi:hypothetical protein
MEKQPSFDRIIGGTEEQKESLEEKSEKQSQKTGKKIYGEYLVQPTEDELKTIVEAVDYANNIAVQYGATRIADAQRVFLLKPGSVEAVTKGNIGNGLYNSLKQCIAINRTGSNAILASRVVHEAFHMSSYHTAQIDKDGNDELYRSGIEMRGRDNEGSYFVHAQEAIIATLSRRFFDEIVSKNPLYEKRIEQTNQIKDWLLSFIDRKIKDKELREKTKASILDILMLPKPKTTISIFQNPDENDAYKFAYFRGYYEKELESGDVMQERGEERTIFNNVLDSIISESKGQINDKQKLFDDFARAHFTGNYLPLARIIEDALGKGAFRKIAIELGEMKN